MAVTREKISPYGPVKFTTVDEYHAGFSTEVQKILEHMRQLIVKAAPRATETISYNIPAFKINKVLVYYAAYKKHIGFYPTPAALAAFKEKLSKYKTSKGAVQFPIHEPLPAALIKAIVKYRVTQDALQ